MNSPTRLKQSLSQNPTFSLPTKRPFLSQRQAPKLSSFSLLPSRLSSPPKARLQLRKNSPSLSAPSQAESFASRPHAPSRSSALSSVPRRNRSSVQLFVQRTPPGSSSFCCPELRLTPLA